MYSMLVALALAQTGPRPLIYQGVLQSPAPGLVNLYVPAGGDPPGWTAYRLVFPAGYPLPSSLPAAAAVQGHAGQRDGHSYLFVLGLSTVAPGQSPPGGPASAPGGSPPPGAMSVRPRSSAGAPSVPDSGSLPSPGWYFIPLDGSPPRRVAGPGR
jgi:hypothetical protein